MAIELVVINTQDLFTSKLFTFSSFFGSYKFFDRHPPFKNRSQYINNSSVIISPQREKPLILIFECQLTFKSGHFLMNLTFKSGHLK